jgi:hypothetical protein
MDFRGGSEYVGWRISKADVPIVDALFASGFDQATSKEFVMNHSLACVAVAFLLCVASARASDDAATTEAQAASREWLAFVDAGNYAKSWDAAAALFKNKVTKSDWESAVGAAREPLGALKERKLESAEYTERLPGAPDGEYVVITYHTSFANRPSATETITPTRDADGHWRVSGYFIK